MHWSKLNVLKHAEDNVTLGTNTEQKREKFNSITEDFEISEAVENKEVK